MEDTSTDNPIALDARAMLAALQACGEAMRPIVEALQQWADAVIKAVREWWQALPLRLRLRLRQAYASNARARALRIAVQMSRAGYRRHGSNGWRLNL